MRHLPGLGSLRVFEAAARLKGFSRAAHELNVTPAAVSNQIRLLEEMLGVTLFERSTRVIRLTSGGEELLVAVSEALALIEQSIRKVTRRSSRSVLNVTASPSFASKWLVPRLERFTEIFPNVDVRLDASARVIDLAKEDIDIGIRFGAGRYPHLRADRLSDELVFPVCSPALTSGPKRLSKPNDLVNFRLLHVDSRMQGDIWPSWHMWLTAAGATDVDAKAGAKFGHTALAIQAAIDGQGVALGKSSLVRDDLLQGRLVRPFPLSLPFPSAFAYYVISLKERENEPLIKGFRDWLLVEVGKEVDVDTGL